MSISSSFRVDDSTTLAKQFALMTVGYVDNPPKTAEDPSALVPLENVFRLLEMFRYDAFADENREGVLAMDSPDQLYRMRVETKPWHEQIALALESARQEVYSGQSKEEAIDELQKSIRELVKSHSLENGMAQRAKAFFTALQTQLS